MSTMSYSTVSRWSLSVLSISPVLVTVTAQLTLLELGYCPTSFPVRIARGSVSGQLAPVLIWNTQVLYQASGPYRTRVRIRPLDNTVLL